MRKETVDELCEALAIWFPASRPQPDVELASLLLSYKGEARKENPLLWRARDVEGLLLRTLPAEALLTGDEAPAVLDALSALLAFLEQSGRLMKGSAAVDDLLSEVTEPRLRKALDDPRLWGLDKTIFAAAGRSGVDVTDDLAMEAFARSLVGVDPLPGQGIELPARRLAEPSVLGQEARDTAAFSAGIGLAAWVGDGRSVTREFLTKAGALEAQAELGLTPEQLRSTWTLAWDWGLLNVGTKKAHGTPPPVQEQEWLDAWLDAFGVLLNDPPEPAAEGDHIWHQPVDESVLLILSLAYAVPDGLPREEAVDLAWELMGEQELRGVEPPAVTRGPWRAGLSAYLDERLHGLRMLGVITDATDVVELTALGLAGVSSLVTEFGGSAPTFTSAATMEAGAVLDLADFCVDPVLEEWLADRDPAEATRDLLSAASTRGSAARVAAFAVAADLDALVHPVVAKWSGHPTMGPHARALLAGDAAEPTDAAWLIVDVASTAVENPELLQSQFDELPPDAYDALVGELWRIEHPDTVAVLEALGQHPDKARAKVARKAAFKAHSRR